MSEIWILRLVHRALCFGVILFLGEVKIVSYAEKMNPTQAELRMVNLEATVVTRSIGLLSWQETHLPPLPQPVKLLLVGHDYCLLKERLKYLITESQTNIAGRNIDIVACSSIKEAKLFCSDKSVVFVILLKGLAKHWDSREFVDRTGLVLYGQGKNFMRQGLSLSSRVENNRLKISVNLKKMKSADIAVNQSLFLLNRILSVTE